MYVIYLYILRNAAFFWLYHQGTIKDRKDLKKKKIGESTTEKK